MHPALLLYFLYASIAGHLMFITAATLSILLHEAAHALTSSLMGYPPTRLELTPMGAVMHLEDDSRIPVLKRIAVVLAGPVITLCICWGSLYGTTNGILDAGLGRLLFLSNLSILMLNLLPVLPLDGGRLLTIVLGSFCPQRMVSRIMQGLGYTLGTCLILLNIWCSWRLGGWNLSLAFAGCCLMYSAAISSTTRAMAELQSFMDRKIRLERKGSIKTCCITCLNTETVAKLIRKLPANQNAVYLCHEAGSMKLLGWIDEYSLVQWYLQNPSSNVDTCLLANQNKSECQFGTI